MTDPDPDPDTDARLDGTPEEFPHRERAMALYRTLWSAWLMSADPEDKVRLQQEMDAAQLEIARGPGKVWREFARSLPGYEQWWANLAWKVLSRLDHDG